MATFKPYISANTLLHNIISNELSEDFPFGARKLPLKKRFKHALFLTNEGLRTVEDLARFVRANEFDIEVYTSLESQREIHAILHACYPTESFAFSHTARINYTGQNDLSYPWAEFNLLYNDLYAKIGSEDFGPGHCYEVERALDLLNELERSIVELRYGFGEHELPTTCAEIAMLYKIEDEFVSENEVQFFINDCLKIMSTGKNTEALIGKTTTGTNLALIHKVSKLEKALQESAEDNAKLKAGLIKLAEANKQLESDSSYYWKRANSLNDEIVDLEEKLKDLEIQLKEKTIKLANANLAIESSKKALANSIYACEQLRQVGPARLEIYQIARNSLQEKAKDDPITAEVYESRLTISEAAHKYLRKKMCFTYRQILQLINEEGWGLMVDHHKRSIITEIMFAINYDPEIKQASIDSIGLSTRAFNALSKNGYKTTEDIKQAAINGKLYEARTLGAKTLEEVLIKTGLKVNRG